MHETLVKECILFPRKLHDMVRRARTPEEVERFFPGVTVFVDATEQEKLRPNDALKKGPITRVRGRGTPSRKTQLTVNSNCLIVPKTNQARGRRRDLDIYLERRPGLPEQVEQCFDRVYDGVKKYFPRFKCAILFKRRCPGKGFRGDENKKGFGETKKPHTVYGWDEFVSSMPK